ncbi:hypothetical protein VINI7043_16113 [Vibrio nigripulchritudo ATCC 27043]|uniref:hypothetical protein n=1 Tax=Vibrio nigripulchritudo TaxID=28173 RepID=UPI00021C2988|nr:hypothetical protein [Vibrio nigripulchritudo]EGU61601.1 hypothetical protein VINI7043_16113 [Vibrio nigripulchritudo ATCC 27043]
MFSLSMTSDVGSKSTNKAVDVQLIKALLNTYARKNNLKPLSLKNNKVDEDFITLIKVFQKKVVKMRVPDGIVSANRGTFKKLSSYLRSCYTITSITAPSTGILTWNEEGREGGIYHSRSFHVPSSSSGLTIGRGYDMKEKTSAQIKSHLALAQIEAKKADVISLAAGKKGNAAKQFVIENDLLDFEITAPAQLKLFNIVYKELEADVKRICQKKTVVTTYGTTNWQTLNSKIKDVLIDLRFRGDYHGSSRKKIQEHVANNDLESFKAEISKQENWTNVPAKRRKARINYLNS